MHHTALDPRQDLLEREVTEMSTQRAAERTNLMKGFASATKQMLIQISTLVRCNAMAHQL